MMYINIQKIVTIPNVEENLVKKKRPRKRPRKRPEIKS